MNLFRLLPPALILAASAAHSQESSMIPGEFSASVALTSNYTFRGITQTDDEPAIQGSFDYSASLTDEVGFYAGVWGSNVDFNDGDEATIEIDFYSGLTYQLGPVGLDLGVLYYWYPGAADALNYDYFEVAFGAEFTPVDPLTISVGYAYSPENFGDSGDAHYLSAGADYTLPFDLSVPITLSGTIGYQFIEEELTFGAPDYLDWSVGISADFDRFTASFAYVDNDITGGDDANFVFTIGASF